jgi:hypothetical protein
MKRIQIITLAILSIIIGSSCTKEIEFNEKTLEPKLVVNAICTLDSLITVEVSANKPIPGYETNFKLFTDATVKLYVDGLETEQLEYIGSSKTGYPCAIYGSKSKAESRKLYKIEVSHNDYKTTATGEMQMGKKVPVLEVTTTPIINVVYNSENSKKIEATLTFSDPADEENYYRLVVSYRIGKDQSHPDSNGDTIHLVQVMDYAFSYNGIESDDPVFSNNENADEMLFESSKSMYTVFTDELFNGKTYDLNFYLSDNLTYDLQRLDIARGDFYIIKFELQSLTKDTYYYIKSLGSSMWSNDDLFSEPVQVFNNIENGLGIFGGCSSSVYSLQEGIYPRSDVEYYYGSVSY